MKTATHVLTRVELVNLRKSVVIFKEPNVLLVRHSSFGRAGEAVLSPSVFRVSLCRH